MDDDGRRDRTRRCRLCQRRPWESLDVVNVRYTADYPPAKIEQDLELRAVDLEFKYVDPRFHTLADHDGLQTLQRAIRETMPEGSNCIRKAPASDMRFFSEHGTPGVVFGPDGYDAHSQDEYADISSFGPDVGSLVAFVRQYS